MGDRDCGWVGSSLSHVCLAKALPCLVTPYWEGSSPSTALCTVRPAWLQGVHPNFIPIMHSLLLELFFFFLMKITLEFFSIFGFRETQKTKLINNKIKLFIPWCHTEREWADFNSSFYTHTLGINGGFRLTVWGLLCPNRG